MNEKLYQFELDKKYIEEYPLETTEGTKKVIKTYHINAVSSRNAYVNNKLEEYTELKNQVYEELNKRVESLIPKETTNNYINLRNTIISYDNIIKNNNRFNTIYEKLDLDKIITDIGDIDISNLVEVNNLIKRVFAIYTNAGINLSLNDFEYSNYTKIYMETYFKSINAETFNDAMKQVFDQIYWECPNLITHIKLNLRSLYEKYKSQLTTYQQNLTNNLYSTYNTDLNNYMNNYISLSNNLEESLSKDSYLLSYKFLNGDLSIYEYLNDTPQVRKHYNRFLIDKEYIDLDDKEMINFYAEIRKLKNVVVELNNYNLYKAFINDIKNRYKVKETYKGLYQNKLKEIEKEEKERSNLVTQYNAKPKKFLFFTKKEENKDLLKVKINDQIKKLNDLYKELDDIYVNEVISTKLDDTSTLYDALELCSSFYSYFKKIYNNQNPNTKENDFMDAYNKLIEYVNDVNNTFIKKIIFIDEMDVNDIILDKYKLLNINLTKDDLTDNIKQLEDSIDFINLRNNINNSTISIDTIKFIIDFKKIKN